MTENEMNSIGFAIMCNFPHFCGEERAKEAADIFRAMKDELLEYRALGTIDNISAALRRTAEDDKAREEGRKTAYDENGTPYLVEAEGSEAKHIIELLEAEAQGLLVELPCKVGDDVFLKLWNIKNQKYEVCAGKIKNVRYDAIDGSVMVSNGEYFRAWGKDAFPIRDMADAALSGGGANV